MRIYVVISCLNHPLFNPCKLITYISDYTMPITYLNTLQSSNTLCPVAFALRACVELSTSFFLLLYPLLFCVIYYRVLI